MSRNRVTGVAEFAAIQFTKALEDYERVRMAEKMYGGKSMTEEAHKALKPLLEILVFSMNKSELNSELQLPLSVAENGDAIKKIANELGLEKVSSFVDSENFRICLANARRDAGIPAAELEGGASAAAAAGASVEIKK